MIDNAVFLFEICLLVWLTLYALKNDDKDND